MGRSDQPGVDQHPRHPDALLNHNLSHNDQDLGEADRPAVFARHHCDQQQPGRCAPQRVRDKAISKASSKVRRLGIPRTASRIVQVIVSMVLEPIFEADFERCSYGSCRVWLPAESRGAGRDRRDSFLASPSRNDDCVFAADIKACFDEVDYVPLIRPARERVGKDHRRGPVPVLAEAAARQHAAYPDATSR